MIQRYSSRRSPLKDFLATRLQGACRYDRIAGFFSSSLLEVAGDTLEDVWVAAALKDEEEAKRVIAAVPKRHPFEMRYDRIENVDWESCSRVLDSAIQLEALREGW